MSVREALAKKASIIFTVFGTEQGQKVLEILEDEFDGQDLRGGDPYETYYNLGARDVVTYIRQLVNHHKES